MGKLQTRSTPLTPSEKEDFFAAHTGGHLAYRYTMLWTHKRYAGTPGMMSFGQAICAFEASLMACRVFLEFLGLGVFYGSQQPSLVEKREYYAYDGRTTDEVKVVDLGGRYARITDITPQENQLLANVYHMAHKATAHLTHGAAFMADAAIVHQAIPVIDRLLRQNLYEVVGRQPHGHW